MKQLRQMADLFAGDHKKLKNCNFDILDAFQEEVLEMSG